MIIPADFEVSKWEKETAQNILDQLRRLTNDAFYRMAEEVGIDLGLLGKAGYEYSGISELSMIELEACLSETKYKEVEELISSDDFLRDRDFQYVLFLYDNQKNVIKEYYSDEKGGDISQYKKYILQDERESMIELMRLFIEEFYKDKSEARKKVLEEYGGHLISIPELDSLLANRDVIAWYRGDTFDPGYEESIQKMKAMRDLVPLYKLLSGNGGYQIQSTIYRHRKVTIDNNSAQLLAQAVAIALKLLHDTNSDISIPTQVDKSYVWYELLAAGNDIDEILEDIESGIDSFESESDLNLFYYLADNAIKWPTNISLTDRYLFLYRLAKFFNHVQGAEYDGTTYFATRKEIVEAIKYRIRQMRIKNKDKNLLNSYLKNDTL